MTGLAVILRQETLIQCILVGVLPIAEEVAAGTTEGSVGLATVLRSLTMAFQAFLRLRFPAYR